MSRVESVLRVGVTEGASFTGILVGAYVVFFGWNSDMGYGCWLGCIFLFLLALFHQ